MVGDVTATTATSAAADAMKKSVGMNKDDFLKLFIAQMQYQDPLKPQDPSAMLDQLSQLSLVEQSYNSTTALQNLLTAQSDSLAMTSVSFIGKNVKAYGNAAVFDGAAASQLQYNLAQPTDSATITISDSTGKTVRTISVGASASGDNSCVWDGRDGNGNLLPAGAYTFSVTGTTVSGTTVKATTYTTGRVDGVTIVNGKPLLAVGAASVSLSDVISIKGV